MSSPLVVLLSSISHLSTNKKRPIVTKFTHNHYIFQIERLLNYEGRQCGVSSSFSLSQVNSTMKAPRRIIMLLVFVIFSAVKAEEEAFYESDEVSHELLDEESKDLEDFFDSDQVRVLMHLCLDYSLNRQRTLRPHSYFRSTLRQFSLRFFETLF